MRPTSIRQFVLGTALAGAIGLGGGIGVLAQDPPMPEAHPAHIHVGTCAELDPNPVAPLNNLLPVGVDPEAEEPEALETLGSLTAGPVSTSQSEDVEFEWETMLGSSHAIAVHESETNIQNYIACGDIGGVVFDDEGNKMVVGLHPVGESGFSGIAILSEDGDGMVDVEVYLTGQPADGSAEPAATPAN